MKISSFLKTFSKDESITSIILNLCGSAIKISKSIHDDDYEIENTSKNTDGDIQKPLDIFSDKTLLDFISISEVAAYCSEEQKGIVKLNRNGKFIVVTDPLDGSSNIDANVSIGTIFSIIPTNGLNAEDAIFQKGNKQACSGFFVYGPRTTLFLTFKSGTHSVWFAEKSA